MCTCDVQQVIVMGERELIQPCTTHSILQKERGGGVGQMESEIVVEIVLWPEVEYVHVPITNGREHDRNST